MKKATFKFWLVLVLTFIIGFILAKIDTSKNWDDTAITVGLILVSSFLLGVIMPKFAWLWAIILTAFIFGFNVVQSNNYGSAAALIFTFIGAYCGVFFKKFLFQAT